MRYLVILALLAVQVACFVWTCGRQTSIDVSMKKISDINPDSVVSRFDPTILASPTTSIPVPFSKKNNNVREPGIPLLEMSHEELYLSHGIAEWNNFVDRHVQTHNKKFYLVNFNRIEVTSVCQDYFEVLETDQDISETDMMPFYNSVVTAFDVRGNMQTKLKIRILAIGAAGFAVASCFDSQISIEDIKHDKVRYLTHNLKVLKRLIGTPEKKAIFENLIDQSGLEHLISLRGVLNDGTYINYW